MGIKNQFENLKQDIRLRGYSEKTAEAYVNANQKFIEFIKKPANLITSADIKKYIGYLLDKKHKPKTINLIISALKYYYDEFRGRNLFRKIKRVKLEKHIPTVLSKQELKRLISVTKNKKHRLIIKFLYSTGIRAGELIKVKIQDLDLENGYLRVIFGKGKKDRLTIISKKLCREIKEFISEKQIYLFESNRKKHLTIRAIEVIIKTSAKKANIKRSIFPHALRASFATHLYNEGTQIQKIQKLMGHADFKTTLGYTRSAIVDISDVKNPLDNI